MAGTSERIQLRPEDIVWRSVDGEIVLLDRRTWAYVGINGTGAALWHHVVGGTTRENLVQALLAAFEVDEPTARADVDSFVATLHDHDLLAAPRDPDG
jgi:hypothetical protein